jgi:DNA-binding protein H-NS
MSNEVTTSDIDLSNKSIDELKKLQDEIASQIEETERNVVIDFYESFNKKAQEMGFESIQDLHSTYLEYKALAKKNSKKVQIDPVYRSSKNPSDTWTGRGKHPRWLVQEAKEQNKTVAEILPGLLIADQK